MSRKIKAVLIDLSGTLHVDDLVLPGAVAAVNRLRASGLQMRFATNTTKESRRLLWERLRKLGFDSIEEGEIFTSLTAARDVVARKQLRPLLMIDDAALSDFHGVLPIDQIATAQYRANADSVLVGLAPDKFNYEQMNTAMNLLLKGAPLIAIHKGRYYKRKDGLALGPGPFVRALEHAADCEALVVGKPEAAFFKAAIEPFGCEPQEVVMIGDDAKDDVAGAQVIGLTGMLVQTGKYREGDENKINPRPNYVCTSVSDAVDIILTQLI